MLKWYLISSIPIYSSFEYTTERQAAKNIVSWAANRGVWQWNSKEICHRFEIWIGRFGIVSGMMHSSAKKTFLFSSPESRRLTRWAILITLRPSSVRRPSVRKQFLQTSSPTILLGQIQPNFTGMFLAWSSSEFLQRNQFHAELWLPWQPKGKT